MPFVPIPATLQANIRFLLAGQQCEICLHFSYADSDFETAVDNVGDAIATEWWPVARAFLSNQLVSNGIYFVDQSSASGPVSLRAPFATPQGASSIFAAPGNVAFTITHRTANRGRSYRGRSYMLGIPADQIGAGLLSTGARDAYVSAFNTLRLEAASDGNPFVIASRYANGSPRTTGVATPVTQCEAVDLVVDSQRRRLPGRGN